MNIILYQYSLGGEISGAQIAPASSVWSQLCTPTSFAGQSSSSASVPRHLVLSTKIGPLPWPKPARKIGIAPEFVHKTSLKVSQFYVVHMYLILRIPAVYTQHLHQFVPSYHHTLCPMFYCSKLRPFLQELYYHWPIGRFLVHHWCILLWKRYNDR